MIPRFLLDELHPRLFLNGVPLLVSLLHDVGEEGVGVCLPDTTALSMRAATTVRDRELERNN